MKDRNNFAEWFSIDPPFPDGIFGDDKLIGGAYVNGGIMPLVGGELAKAALDNGFEKYGIDILKKYYNLIKNSGETYLWYFPDGTPASIETSPSPEAEPTDGWGSSAMLYALVEGLAGIEDIGKSFNKVRLSPRWPAADVFSAEVNAMYRASGKEFGYHYQFKDEIINIELKVIESEVDCHIFLPENKIVLSVEVNGNAIDFENTNINNSKYIDFRINVNNNYKIKIHLANEKD